MLCFVLSLGFSLVLSAQTTKEQLAAQFYNNGEFAQAAELYEPLYQKTLNRYYYQMLYHCYVELGDSRRAEQLVEQRMRKFDKDLTLYVDLGALFEKAGNTKKAQKNYDKAFDKLGTDSRQTTDLATAFENFNKLDLAVAVFQRSRELTKNSFLYVSELTSLYSRMGRYEDVIQEYFNLLDKSPGSIGSVQISLQRMLNESVDSRLEEGLKRTLMQRVREQSNNKTYLDMMIWFSLQQKDFRFALTQAKAVDARFPDLGGEQLYRVAQIAYSNGAFDVAHDCYSLLLKKGPESPYYYDSRVGDLETQFAQLNPNVSASKKSLKALQSRYLEAIEELGKNERSVVLMRNYAHLSAYYLDEVQPAADMLYDILDIPRLPQSVVSNVKLELGDLMLFAGEVWEASLLYMQVEKANKNDLVGAQAKFKNAKLSYYNHDFLWAKSQLSVLRASTSKLIANDAMELSLLISDNMEEDSTFDMLELYAAADLLLYRNKLDSAWIAFDDISHRALSHPIFDEVLLQKAKIRMRQAKYVEADSLLAQLFSFYPEDILADDALMLRAQLNENQLNNIEQARSCYETLILDYPSSLYVDQARKKYNELKK